MTDSLTLTATPGFEITTRPRCHYAELVDSFLASLDLKPRTIEAYRKGLSYFFSWLDSQGISNPTRADVKRYKDQLASTYKPSTTAAYLAAVRCFFRELANESGRPELNLAEGVRSPKGTKGHKKDALTAEQARHVLETMPRETLADKRDFAMVSLMLHEGLRTVEVSRLNLEDIRNGGTVMDVWGKGRDVADETLPLAPNAFKALRDYLDAREQVDGKPKPEEPIFVSLSPRDYGQRMATRSISRICKGALVAAGFDDPRLTAHSFRHTAVSLAIQSGASLHEAQLLARHSSPNTTEIYVHDVERLKNGAVSGIEGLLAG